MMTDEQTTEQAIAAFHNLSGDDMMQLKALNTRVQSHKEKWGKRMGGQQIAEYSFEEPWIQNDPLIGELIFDFMGGKGLLILYVWDDWNDSHTELFASTDPSKYDKLDLRTALIIVSGAVRKDRFASGSLVRAFESGGFPKLINRLVKLAGV